MGKRKSKTKPQPKKRVKLDTVFDCPFCNHTGSVECDIDMKELIGEAKCGICQEHYSTTVTALTEPIDIYSEWIDACERVNKREDEDGDEDEDEDGDEDEVENVNEDEYEDEDEDAFQEFKDTDKSSNKYKRTPEKHHENIDTYDSDE
ncbi:hypothetical protein OROGR_000186 [Orobanche gracilis]